MVSVMIRYDNLVTYCRSSDQKTHNALVPGIIAACVLITVAILIVICWRLQSNPIKKSLNPSVSLSSKSKLKFIGWRPYLRGLTIFFSSEFVHALD